MLKRFLPLIVLFILVITVSAQHSEQVEQGMQETFRTEVREGIEQDNNQLNVFGTEYEIGDQGRVFLQLLDTNVPVNNASCKIDIFNPNGTFLFDNVAMVHQANSDGLYFFDLAIPEPVGIYMLTADCVFSNIEFVFYNPDFFPFIVSEPKLIEVLGTTLGTPSAMNQFDDSLYVEHDSSSGSPKEAEFQMEWNLSKSSPPASVENATELTLFYSGESTSVQTATFELFNFTADAFQLLPNVLIFQGTAGSSPSGIAQFVSNTISGNVSDFVSENNTVLASFDTTGGSTFTVFHNWMNIRLTTLEDVSINEIRGGGEIHVSEGAGSGKFEVGLCPTNQTSALLFIIFLIVSGVFIAIGLLAENAGPIGFIGSLMLLPLSWTLAGCIAILSFVFAVLGLVGLAVFAIRGLD